MKIARWLPKSVRMLGGLFTCLLGLIILVLTTYRLDPNFHCLIVSTANGNTLIDVLYGRSTPIPTVIAPRDIAFNMPSPGGEQSIYVVWTENGGSPPYPNTQFAHVSIGTRTNPRAIPLDDVYVHRPLGEMYTPNYFDGAWAPNGKLIYIWTSQDGRFHMTRVDADGTNKETYSLSDFQRLLFGADSPFSTDGAYFATTTIKYHNNLVNIWSTSDLHLVSSFVADDGAFAAAWSHNGHRLFYAADSKIYPFIIALPDLQSAILITFPDVQSAILNSFPNMQSSALSYSPENLMVEGSRIIWSSDDNWILVNSTSPYSSLAYQALEFRPDGKLQQVLLGYIADLSFDQQKFIIVGRRYPYSPTNDWKIVNGFSGTTEYILSDVVATYPDPRNSHRFAIARQRTKDELEVDLMDEDGQNRQSVYKTNEWLGQRGIDWSPDGGKILVNTSNGSRDQLSLLTIDGTLLLEAANVVDWQWLRNGEALVYVESQNGHFTLKTYDVMSGQQKIIVDEMQHIVLEDIDPQTDLFFGFYWETSAGTTGADVYDPSGQRKYRVLTPNLFENGLLQQYNFRRPKMLFQSPEGQFIAAYNSYMEMFFVFSDNHTVVVPIIYSPPTPHWSHCDLYDSGDSSMSKVK